MSLPERVSIKKLQKELIERLGVNPKKQFDKTTLTEETITSVRKVNPWFLRDLISVMDVKSLAELRYLFATAAELKAYGERYSVFSLPVLKGFLIATMFYEASTRTRLSFESALERLGGEILSTADGARTSSSTKGETLSDATKMVAHYADLIIQRHPVAGSAALAAEASDVPVINAGDGAGEHPTQALLDLFTITEKLGENLAGKVITFAGDIKNSRTVHSLALLLRFYPGVYLFFVSPPGLELPDEYRSKLEQLGVLFGESHDFNGRVAVSDILYMTRVQKERFEDPEEYEKYKNSFVLNADIMKTYLPSYAWVMHPLPRVDEIDKDVDADPRSLYLNDQARNGLPVRMALLLRTLTMPVEQRKDKK